MPDFITDYYDATRRVLTAGMQFSIQRTGDEFVVTVRWQDKVEQSARVVGPHQFGRAIDRLYIRTLDSIPHVNL